MSSNRSSVPISVKKSAILYVRKPAIDPRNWSFEITLKVDILSRSNTKFLAARKKITNAGINSLPFASFSSNFSPRTDAFEDRFANPDNCNL